MTDAGTLTSWQHTFREGFAPLLSVQELELLRAALASDSSELLQGATTEPPPIQAYADTPCVRACLLCYPGWKAGGLVTVEEVESLWVALCYEIDRRMGEPAACRYIVNAWDETPGAEFRLPLLAEVELALTQRCGEAA